MTLHWCNVSCAVVDEYEYDCVDRSPMYRSCHGEDRQVQLELPQQQLSARTTIAGHLLRWCFEALQTSGACKTPQSSLSAASSSRTASWMLHFLSTELMWSDHQSTPTGLWPSSSSRSPYSRRRGSRWKAYVGPMTWPSQRSFLWSKRYSYR